MPEYLTVVYDKSVEEQLQQLSDSDLRYSLEPESYEWLLARNPEGLGTPVVVEERPIYVFRAARRADDLPPLLITYIIDRPNGQVIILDVRLTW